MSASTEYVFVLTAEPVIIAAEDRAEAIKAYRDYLLQDNFSVRLASFPDAESAHRAIDEYITACLDEVDDGAATE